MAEKSDVKAKPEDAPKRDSSEPSGDDLVFSATGAHHSEIKETDDPIVVEQHLTDV